MWNLAAFTFYYFELNCVFHYKKSFRFTFDKFFGRIQEFLNSWTGVCRKTKLMLEGEEIPSLNLSSFAASYLQL